MSSIRTTVPFHFPVYQVGHCDELYGIAQGGLLPSVGQHYILILSHLYFFLLTMDAQDLGEC